MDRCPLGEYYGCPEVDCCEAYDQLQRDFQDLGPDLVSVAIWCDTGRLLALSATGVVTGCIRIRPDDDRPPLRL